MNLTRQISRLPVETMTARQISLATGCLQSSVYRAVKRLGRDCRRSIIEPTAVIVQADVEERWESLLRGRRFNGVRP